MTEDFLLDEDFDLMEDENGELIVGDCTAQEVECLLWEQKGERKEAPTVGFGITSWLKGVEQGMISENMFKRALMVELGTDGKQSATILFNSFSDFKIEINE